MIEFRFYGGADLFARIVQLATMSPYSHCGVVVGERYYEAVGSGVRACPAEQAPVATAALAFVPEADEEQRAARWAEAQVGDEYGYLALAFVWLAIATPLRWIVTPASAWVCSTFCAQVACIAGVFDGEPRIQSPESLAAALTARSRVAVPERSA